MSPLFWHLTTIYAICLVLAIIGVLLAADEDAKLEASGVVIIVGAAIYALVTISSLA